MLLHPGGVQSARLDINPSIRQRKQVPAALHAPWHGKSCIKVRALTCVQARVCDMKPQTLEHDRYTGEVQPGSDERPLKRFLLRLGGYYSRESRLMRGAQAGRADLPWALCRVAPAHCVHW